MSQRLISIFVLLMSLTFTGFAKPVKVALTYNQEEVTLIYNDMVYKDSPKKISVEFQLGGSIIAFKPGYESQIVKILPEEPFSSYHFNLESLENKFSQKNLHVELKKAAFINYVTNFTQEEVTDIIYSKMNKCGITTFTENSIFKNVKGDSQEYSIGVEVIKSNNKNAAYTPPNYLLSYQKIKWYVLENASQRILVDITTEGIYLVYFKPQRGVVASERLREITILALDEATQKFINSVEFREATEKIASK